MDLIAALALVLVIEGMALVVFAASVPALLATMAELDPQALRWVGLVALAIGAVGYLLIRDPGALGLAQTGSP